MKFEHVDRWSRFLTEHSKIELKDPDILTHRKDNDLIAFYYGKDDCYGAFNFSPYREYCTYQLMTLDDRDIMSFKVFCDIPDDLATIAILELGKQFFWMPKKYHFEKVSNHARL